MPTTNSNSKNEKNHENQGNKTHNKNNMSSGKTTTGKSPSAHDKASGMDEKRRGTSDSNGL